MKPTEQVKIEQPFKDDRNRIYYINVGRCSGKVNKVVDELVDCINKLEQENQELKKQLKELEEHSANAINKQVARCIDLVNQQKEFINWLIENESLDDYCNETTFTFIREKYEEIIGGKDES